MFKTMFVKSILATTLLTAGVSMVPVSGHADNATAIKATDQQVTYSVPILFKVDGKTMQGPVLPATGYVGQKVALDNTQIQVPSGYQIAKTNHQYRFTLQNDGYLTGIKLKQYWYHYQGSVIINLRPQVIKNVLIQYYRGKQLVKRQWVGGFMGHTISEKVLTIPHNYVLAANFVWGKHTYSTQPQTINVPVSYWNDLK